MRLLREGLKVADAARRALSGRRHRRDSSGSHIVNNSQQVSGTGSAGLNLPESPSSQPIDLADAVRESDADVKRYLDDHQVTQRTLDLVISV